MNDRESIPTIDELETHVYPKSFVDALPPFDAKRINPWTVGVTRRGEDWAVRRRDRIEEWYAAIGRQDAHLLTRLRDDDDAQAAEFELTVHAALRCRGIPVEWSPQIEQQNPDLRALLGGRASIIEVLTREEPAELSRHNRRLQEFKIPLEAGGGVSLLMFGGIPDSVPDHEIADLGHRAAAALVAPENGVLGGPPLDLDQFGLKGIATRLSIPVTDLNGPMIRGDDINPLRVRLVEKAQKYKWLKTLRTPYVVVVCRGVRSLVRRDAVEQAMLGREMISVGVSERGPTGEIGTTRKYDGVVTKPRKGKPRYSRISAIVYCERDDCATETLCRFAVFHNPYAMNPLTPGAFGGFPELTWTIDGSMYVGDWSTDPDSWFSI